MGSTQCHMRGRSSIRSKKCRPAHFLADHQVERLDVLYRCSPDDFPVSCIYNPIEGSSSGPMRVSPKPLYPSPRQRAEISGISTDSQLGELFVYRRLELSTTRQSSEIRRPGLAISMCWLYCLTTTSLRMSNHPGRLPVENSLLLT